MVRYLFVAGTLAAALCANGCSAEAAKESSQGKTKTPIVAEKPKEDIEEIEVSGQTDAPVKEAYGEGVPSRLPSHDSYDRNTGLPNRTQSDSDYNLD